MMLRRVLAALLVLGAVGYSSWLLELVLDTRVDPLRGYASELAATDQPYGFLFRTGDLLTGLVLTVAGGIGWWRLRRGWPTAAAWGGLLLFAVATMVDSRLALSCSTDADPGCAAREAAGLVPLTHELHPVSSATAIAGAVVSALAFAFASRRHEWPSWLRRAWECVVVVLVGATVWTLTAVEQPGAYLGLAQRTQLLAVGAWLVLAALSVRHLHGST